jgi:hypothetical protein
MLLLTIDPPPAAIWRWCSGFVFATQVAFVSTGRSPKHSIPAAEFQAVSKNMYYSMAALGSIALMLQVINIALWNRFWPFFAALFLQLILALAQFVRMVLLSPPNS